MTAGGGSVEFVAIARTIKVGRTTFAQLYDRLVEPHVPDRAQQFMTLAKLRERRLPGLGGPDKDAADFAEALRQMSELNLLDQFFTRHAQQLFANEADANRSLQSVTNLREVFHASLPLTIGRMNALRRCCRITCERDFQEPEKGSGFLVGPHLVLTNFHVVKSLIAVETAQAESGAETTAFTAQDGSGPRLRVEFDVVRRADGSVERTTTYTATDKWLVACSPVHAHETAGGGPDGGGPWPASPDELARTLDFAIIEIDGTPGHERGWYDLDEVRWPIAGNALDLYQFPRGQPMVTMAGKFSAPGVFSDNQQPPRILHDANTTRGSSGGLCLDHETRAVALHQAGYEFEPGSDADGNAIEKAVRNAAIPLPLIAAAARDKVRAKIASAPRLVFSAPDGAPILGRGRLQRLVDEMIRGNFRILVVQPQAGPATCCGKLGKTFSKKIIRTLLPPGEHVVFEVAAARLTSNAYLAARTLVEPASPDLAASLPSAPPEFRAFGAKEADGLAQSVVEKLVEAAGNSVLWLVIDDLDRFPVQAETASAIFLDAFYGLAAAKGNLRIVLVGPAQIPPGAPGLQTRVDPLRDHISDADVESWITHQFRERVPLLPGQAQILGRVVRSMGTAAANDPAIGRTSAAAADLANHWVPALRAQG